MQSIFATGGDLIPVPFLFIITVNTLTVVAADIKNWFELFYVVSTMLLAPNIYFAKKAWTKGVLPELSLQLFTQHCFPKRW